MMRVQTSIVGLTLAILAASAVVMSAPQGHGRKLDAAEEEAMHWLQGFNGAFNRHDPVGAGALFTADADQRVSGGAFLRGRPAIEVFLAQLFESSPEASQRLWLDSARFSHPDLLLVEAVWEINTGLLEPPRSGFATYLLRREGPDWLCIAGRSMIPAVRPKLLE